MARTSYPTRSRVSQRVWPMHDHATVHKPLRRLKEAGDKLCEAKNARIRELEADLALAGKIHAGALDLLRALCNARLGSPLCAPNLSTGSALNTGDPAAPDAGGLLR